MNLETPEIVKRIPGHLPHFTEQTPGRSVSVRGAGHHKCANAMSRPLLHPSAQRPCLPPHTQRRVLTTTQKTPHVLHGFWVCVFKEIWRR